MFNIFKKPAQIAKQVKESFKQQSTEEVIEEIHNSFETASNRLLNEAKDIIASKIPSEHHEKIAKLGFINAKGVQENENLKKERENQEKIALKLEYYNQKYPFYKFITEKEVQKICEKYNLVFGQCSLYKGEIPKKNVEEISNFVQPKEEDLKYIEIDYFGDHKEISHYSYMLEKENKYKYSVMLHSTYYKDRSFRICAPISDMKTEGYKQEGYKLVKEVKEVPDPIVLFPVSDSMYIIVSKWGLSTDLNQELTNPIEN